MGSLALSAMSLSAQTLSSGLKYHPLSPCRLLDTRTGDGVPLTAARTLTTAACGVPSTARAVAVNLTAVARYNQYNQAIPATLTLWPSNQSQGPATLANPGKVALASNVIVSPAGTNSNGWAADSFRLASDVETHAILDVHGYFSPAAESGGLGFKPLTPCRLVDTRDVSYAPASQPIGGPAISANSSRSFNLGDSTRCGDLPNGGLPADLQAYALTITVLPAGPLGYINVYPTNPGAPMPGTSTMNDVEGHILAGGGVFKAGLNREISVYASESTHVLIDITGYFATNGNTYNAIVPCQFVGSTGNNGYGASGTQHWNVSGTCLNSPALGVAIATNTTVFPYSWNPLGYMTLWNSGAAQPVASMLNALDGKTANNGMIVKVGTNSGMPAISSWITNQVQLLSISATGYFN